MRGLQEESDEESDTAPAHQTLKDRAERTEPDETAKKQHDRRRCRNRNVIERFFCG